jgi:hypothetical protein
MKSHTFRELLSRQPRFIWLSLLLLAATGCVTPGASKRVMPLASETRELSKSQVSERFLLPERSAQNVIYLMVAVNDSKGQDPYEILPDQQIDLQDLISQRGLDGNDLSQEELFDLLLSVELKIRHLLKKRPNLMRAVLYVGQAKNFLSRAHGHRQDMLHPIKQLQTNKVRWIYPVLKNHYVRLAYVVKNIPEQHLSVFECLIGHLFSVLDFKGSAQLGNTKSWELIHKYLSTRKRIEQLKKQKLFNLMEQDRERLREMILPFEKPWAPSIIAPSMIGG